MLKRSVLDVRKPTLIHRWEGGALCHIYKCVGCSCDIFYYPEGSNYPPRELCPVCEYRLGYHEYSHTFEDEVQPDTESESVTNKCAICEAEIKSTRPDVKTCSPKCRKALSRKKHV